MKPTKKKKKVVAKKKKVELEYTLKEGLKYLKDFFEKNTDHQVTKNFWTVLTALRGPDDENYEQKVATTAIIRNAVFGRGSQVSLHALVFSDSNTSLEQRKSTKFNSHHFKLHAKQAFDVLGLKWDEINQW